MKAGLPDLYSPSMVLGCALEFDGDAKGMIGRLKREGRDAVTLNMSGRHVVLLLDGAYAKKYWTARALSSEAALREFGFEQVLGRLNVERGPSWHSALLRRGEVLGPREEFAAVFGRKFGAAWERARGATEIEVYGFLRKAVAEAIIGSLLGEHVDANFAEDFLRFQRNSEKATALCTVFGQWVAGLPLWRAQRQRIALQERLRHVLTSGYMEGLRNLVGDDALLPELAIGILTAAPKNTAIVAASTLVYMVEQGSVDVDASLEYILKETCLPLGGVRKVMGHEPWEVGPYLLPPGTIVSLSHLAMLQDSKDGDWNHSFGGGLHACPGKGFALSMMKTIISSMRPHLNTIIRASPLIHSRPSFADRDFAVISLH